MHFQKVQLENKANVADKFDPHRKNERIDFNSVEIKPTLALSTYIDGEAIPGRSRVADCTIASNTASATQCP